MVSAGDQAEERQRERARLGDGAVGEHIESVFTLKLPFVGGVASYSRISAERISPLDCLVQCRLYAELA